MRFMGVFILTRDGRLLKRFWRTRSISMMPITPMRTGGLFGIFVILDRMKGRGRGFFLIAQSSISILTHGLIALRLVCVLISETTSVLRRLTPARSMAFGSENASLALRNR